jgi:hypothetical protein
MMTLYTLVCLVETEQNRSLLGRGSRRHANITKLSDPLKLITGSPALRAGP